MTTQSWHGLMKEKYQLSLRLFLLLNALSALYSIFHQARDIRQAAVTLPVVIIFIGSLSILIATLWNKKPFIKINFISLLFGLLWAWNTIALKHALQTIDSDWLIIALLGVLFIGAIAFANSLISFLLHCVPVTLTILYISHCAYWAETLFAFMLPTVGITIQQLIQQHNNRFIQGLLRKLQEEKDTLSDLSMMDPLTGLYNRRGFQSRIENLPSNSGSSHFLLLIDIDHFKAYNDHYGHMMGDQALARVSAAIRDAVRSRDIVGRYGGEEFMIILTSVDATQARTTAERIRQRVYDLRIPHMFNESVATNVTVSIGMAPVYNIDVDSALSQADQALYSAKHLGRNNILSFDEIEAL